MSDRIFQAIATTYAGPTNTRPAKIIAKCDAKRISVPWDHALSPEDNHRAAATALARALDWIDSQTTMHGGGIGAGFVWVFVER